jgi:hypothetical protein
MGVFAAAADPDVWRWQPHPEVWVLVIALVGLYAYAALVIGPKVVPAGERALRPRQVLAFAAGVAVLAVASDWPMHDIGEEYLYSVHMTQHLLLTLVMPPLFLLPTWCSEMAGYDEPSGGAPVRSSPVSPSTPPSSPCTGRRWSTPRWPAGHCTTPCTSEWSSPR